MTRGNRDVKNNSVKRLAQSMKRFGYILSAPIIVDENGEIADGQHRLMALQSLNSPIQFTYMVVSEEEARKIPLMNSGRVNWSIRDFLEEQIDFKNKDYIYLQDFMKGYDISSIKFAGEILTTGRKRFYHTNFHRVRDGVGSDNFRMIFNEGKWIPTGKVEARKFMDYVDSLNYKYSKSIGFLKAIRNFYCEENFDKNLFRYKFNAYLKVNNAPETGGVRYYTEFINELI